MTLELYLSIPIGLYSIEAFDMLLLAAQHTKILIQWSLASMLVLPVIENRDNQMYSKLTKRRIRKNFVFFLIRLIVSFEPDQKHCQEAVEGDAIKLYEHINVFSS